MFARMGHGDVLDSLPAELFDCFVAGEAMPGYFLAYQSLLHRSLRQRGVRPGQGLDHEQLQHPGSKLVVIAGAGISATLRRRIASMPRPKAS